MTMIRQPWPRSADALPPGYWTAHHQWTVSLNELIRHDSERHPNGFGYPCEDCGFYSRIEADRFERLEAMGQ